MRPALASVVLSFGCGLLSAEPAKPKLPGGVPVPNRVPPVKVILPDRFPCVTDFSFRVQGQLPPAAQVFVKDKLLTVEEVKEADGATKFRYRIEPEDCGGKVEIRSTDGKVVLDALVDPAPPESGQLIGRLTSVDASLKAIGFGLLSLGLLTLATCGGAIFLLGQHSRRIVRETTAQTREIVDGKYQDLTNRLDSLQAKLVPLTQSSSASSGSTQHSPRGAQQPPRPQVPPVLPAKPARDRMPGDPPSDPRLHSQREIEQRGSASVMRSAPARRSFAAAYDGALRGGTPIQPSEQDTFRFVANVADADPEEADRMPDAARTKLRPHPQGYLQVYEEDDRLLLAPVPIPEIWQSIFKQDWRHYFDMTGDPQDRLIEPAEVKRTSTDDFELVSRGKLG